MWTPLLVHKGIKAKKTTQWIISYLCRRDKNNSKTTLFVDQAECNCQGPKKSVMKTSNLMVPKCSFTTGKQKQIRKISTKNKTYNIALSKNKNFSVQWLSGFTG